MTALVKGPTEGDLLKYDLEKTYTREAVTLLAGTAYPLGAVLGRITASGKFAMSPATGSNGAQTAAGVLLAPVDATEGDAPGVVIARGPAIVSDAELQFDASVDDAPKRAAKLAQLEAIGIVARAAA
jgi:hypothetical protein